MNIKCIAKPKKIELVRKIKIIQLILILFSSYILGCENNNVVKRMTWRDSCNLYFDIKRNLYLDVLKINDTVRVRIPIAYDENGKSFSYHLDCWDELDWIYNDELDAEIYGVYLGVDSNTLNNPDFNILVLEKKNSIWNFGGLRDVNVGDTAHLQISGYEVKRISGFGKKN